MGNRYTSFIRVLIALFYALFAFQAVAQSDRTVAEDSKAFVYEVERLENGTPAGRIPLDLDTPMGLMESFMAAGEEGDW